MLMSKDINCINFKGLLAFIENTYGKTGVETIMDGLVDNPHFMIQDKYDPSVITPIRIDQIIDPTYWVSNEFSMRLLGNVKQVVEGPNPLMTAGIGAVRENLSKSALFAGKVFGPTFLSRQAAKINPRFNRTKEVRLVEIGPKKAVIELHYRHGYKVTKDVCNWNLGIYIGLAKITGVNRVKGQETHCVLSGDPCCKILLTWEKSNWLKRIFKGLLIRLVDTDIREMISEHQATLTERDRLINKLIHSEKKYRTLFEDSMEAMNLTHKGRIQDVNPAWLQLHGFDHKAEVAGRNVFEFVLPEDHAVLAERSQKWPNISDRRFQVRAVRKDGSTVDVEVYSSRIAIDKKKMILTTIRDITSARKAEKEREQLQARLQRAEKMEAIGTLAGSVAHDLNNILSGIVSYPELLLYQLPEDSSLRGPLETILKSGKRATDIVQDLLALARRGVSVIEAVNLNDVVNSYLQSPEFEKLRSYHPHAAISHSLSSDLGYILGSPVHLGKVVMNLISNAAEALSKQGEIRIITENCRLEKAVKGYEAIQPGDYVKLSVADSGIGINGEELQHIFEPFYTKKVLGRSGTGLGMSVVWGTVKDYSGSIDISSSEGKGTVFSLYFPITKQRPTKEEKGPSLGNIRGNGESILVVDDNKDQRTIAEAILKELGYMVQTASSGESAILALQQQSVDLVILDMIMDPGMDGLDTYKQIIATNPTQRVIIASGFSETDRLREARRLGVNAYIRKPYALKTIAKSVHEALNHEKISCM